MDNHNQPNQPNISDLATETAAATETKLLLKKPNYLLWALSGAVGLIFLILIAAVIIAANMVISSAKNLPKLTPSPTKETTETPPPIIHNSYFKSQFATDAAVLSLSQDLKKLRADIDSVDLFETQLSPPSLDLQIKVQQVN